MLKLEEKYHKQAVLAMKEKFGYKNNLAVPRIVKVVINTGFNPEKKDKKAQEEIARDMALITGQKPAPRQAAKAVSAFKTREGMVVGMVATLRGKRMYDFLDRLINIVLPRSRDFRGLLEKNVDERGNLNIGVKEQIVFPEISAESAKNIFGLEIAVVTTAKNHQEGVELFKLLGFPICKK
ncbi:MAG: 50S ribosomal protein L5 [Patescibacteria group bacterium]|nr:50S ribosomal protein L5 [Patescibacteria group bacterium]